MTWSREVSHSSDHNLDLLFYACLYEHGKSHRNLSLILSGNVPRFGKSLVTLVHLSLHPKPTRYNEVICAMKRTSHYEAPSFIYIRVMSRECCAYSCTIKTEVSPTYWTFSREEKSMICGKFRFVLASNNFYKHFDVACLSSVFS